MVDVSNKFGGEVVMSKDGMDSNCKSSILVVVVTLGLVSATTEVVVKSGWESSTSAKKAEMQSRIHCT